MLPLKSIVTISFLCLLLSKGLFSQEHLDDEHAYLKLNEVSADNKYGYKSRKPIKLGSEYRIIEAYLNSLKTIDGDVFHVADMKFNYKGKKDIIKVDLCFVNNEDTIALFFSTKEYVEPKAVYGFTYRRVEDIPEVYIFPSDSVLKVESCYEKVYATNNLLWNDKIGDYPHPMYDCSFRGGFGLLQDYFDEHPLKDESLKGLVFRVTIKFLVNCKGEAGNFEIISDVRGEMKSYANQVLAVVNGMPQRWEHTSEWDDSNDSKFPSPVDCICVLQLEVSSGKIKRLPY